MCLEQTAHRICKLIEQCDPGPSTLCDCNAARDFTLGMELQRARRFAPQSLCDRSGDFEQQLIDLITVLF